MVCLQLPAAQEWQAAHLQPCAKRVHSGCCTITERSIWKDHAQTILYRYRDGDYAEVNLKTSLKIWYIRAIGFVNVIDHDTSLYDRSLTNQFLMMTNASSARLDLRLDLFGFQCRPCSIGTFNAKKGSEGCDRCPPGTTTIEIGATKVRSGIGRLSDVPMQIPA